MNDREQKFSSEEVSQIVREALLLESNDAHTLTYEDLKDVAAQCGVSEAQLNAALEQRDLAASKNLIRRRWRRKAIEALTWPLLVCGGLVVLNVVTGGFPWSIFPILFWLLPQARRVYGRLFPTEEALSKTAERLQST